MNSKQILHDLIVAFKDKDVEKATADFKRYLDKKLNEVYGHSEDFDPSDAYDASDRFTTVEEVDDECELMVADHKVELAYRAKQKGAEHGEEATHTDPGWSEIYEYGPVYDVGYFKSFKVDGVLIDDNFEMLMDATAQRLMSKKGVEEYHVDILETLEQTEHPIPEQIRSLFTPEFAKALVFAFGKYLDSKEGDA